MSIFGWFKGRKNEQPKAGGKTEPERSGESLQPQDQAVAEPVSVPKVPEIILSESERKSLEYKKKVESIRDAFQEAIMAARKFKEAQIQAVLLEKYDPDDPGKVARRSGSLDTKGLNDQNFKAWDDCVLAIDQKIASIEANPSNTRLSMDAIRDVKNMRRESKAMQGFLVMVREVRHWDSNEKGASEIFAAVQKLTVAIDVAEQSLQDEIIASFSKESPERVSVPDRVATRPPSAPAPVQPRMPEPRPEPRNDARMAPPVPPRPSPIRPATPPPPESPRSMPSPPKVEKPVSPPLSLEELEVINKERTELKMKITEARDTFREGVKAARTYRDKLFAKLGPYDVKGELTGAVEQGFRLGDWALTELDKYIEKYMNPDRLDKFTNSRELKTDAVNMIQTGFGSNAIHDFFMLAWNLENYCSKQEGAQEVIKIAKILKVKINELAAPELIMDYPDPAEAKREYDVGKTIRIPWVHDEVERRMEHLSSAEGDNLPVLMRYLRLTGNIPKDAWPGTFVFFSQAAFGGAFHDSDRFKKFMPPEGLDVVE